MKTILVANDDGIDSVPLKILCEHLKNDFNVVVVAPKNQQSGMGHAITYKDPVHIHARGNNIWTVDGTPVDCVYTALSHIFHDSAPDYVLSGINEGGNLGNDVFYSGTVAAAAEAIFQGIPAMALSAVGNDRLQYEAFANYAVKTLQSMLDNPIPNQTLLNINYPDCHPDNVKGVRFTYPGTRLYAKEMIRLLENTNDEYFIYGAHKGYRDRKGSDCNACEEHYISISPLYLSLYHRHIRDVVEKSHGDALVGNFENDRNP